MTIAFTDAPAKSLDIEHLVTVSKGAERELNEKITQKHLQEVIMKVINANRMKQGWYMEIVPATNYSFYKREYNGRAPGETQYTYYVTFKVGCKPDRERPNIEGEFLTVVKDIEQKIKFPAKWEVQNVDGEDWKKRKVEEAKDKEDKANVDIGYMPLSMPEDWETNFEHLYGLDAHISRIKRAIEGTMATGWKKRLHCVLIGPPGCGKSDIAHSIKEALGAENVLEFDATSTTMAGAQKELAERADSGDGLPRVLLVEEIEKADDKSLAWMLSLMDLRGEIRKTTARGKINTDTKMICIATVNDVPTFEKLAFGALASRFSNKVYFRRPSRELLGRILEREVNAIDGNMNWIEPTLNLADEINTSDPREVISLMLCGRDALLDGTFQSEYKWTSAPDGEDERNNGRVK
jgi:ATPase family associated with various cellular activities (AAA)